MGLISNGTTIFDAGAISAGAGSVSFIKKITASADSTISMVHGASNVVFDGTYKEYLITWNCLHPSSTSEPDFLINFRDGGTDYDAPKTTTFFRAQHSQGGSGAELAYDAGGDLVNATGVQRLSVPTGSENDECLSGTMKFYQPASTVFHKHFMSTISNLDMSDYEVNVFVAGFCNVTAAITGVQFSYSTGNIQSGIIKMYGVSK